MTSRRTIHCRLGPARGACEGYNRRSLAFHAQRHRPHPRLRLAVHPAHRASAARAGRLLGDPAARHARRRARLAPPARDRALGRARQRSRQALAALRPEAVRARGAGRRDLLRHAAHEPRARRRGETLRAPRVRAGGVPAVERRGALPRAAAAQPRLGQPRRRHPQGAARLPRHGRDRDERDRRDRERAAPALRHAVPPGGRAHRGGRQGPRQLPRHPGLPPRLERALVRPRSDRARARAGGARRGA